jgi:threonylcarbamoyladenosine tRNA methylthiotransferase MtaB
MKAAFYTLGCKVNQYETQIMEQELARAGYEIVPSDEAADVYVVNSCTVTGESDRKTRQALRRLKAQNPQSVAVLTGCFPQSAPEKAASFTEADVVTGVLGRRNIASLIDKARRTGSRVISVGDFESGEEFEPMSAGGFIGHTRAFVKIEDGCESFCSYCVIPYSRGPVRSKPLAALREEAEGLAARGYREIVLVGINLSAYGKDSGHTLMDAVETVCAAPGVERVRLGSLEPKIVTEEFIERMTRCGKLCAHFHLSLQSGCAETLRRMNRRYDPDEYRRAVNMLREAFPLCGITTDVIVGFPGETKEEFSRSLDFVREMRFSQGHVFPYSRRSGTRAAVMPGQVTKNEKALRAKLMSEVCAQSKEEFLESLKGKTLPVLFEEEKDGIFTGFAPNYAPVRVQGSGLHGRIVEVNITGVLPDACVGVPAG